MTLGTSFHRCTRHWRFCFLVVLSPCWSCSFAPKICSSLPSVPAQARRAELFPVLASWLLGRAKFACLQRQKPAMFAQTPLFVYRHFTGAVCTTLSDGRCALFSAPSTAAFSVASRLSNSSDIFAHLQSRPRCGSPVARTKFKTLIHLKGFGAGACGALASTNKSLAQMNKTQDVGRATEGCSALQSLLSWCGAGRAE